MCTQTTVQCMYDIFYIFKREKITAIHNLGKNITVDPPKMTPKERICSGMAKSKYCEVI